MIKKRSDSKFILNIKNERRMKCTIIPDDYRVLLTTGATTSRSGNFLIHFEFIANSENHAQEIWNKINKTTDILNFSKFCKKTTKPGIPPGYNKRELNMTTTSVKEIAKSAIQIIIKSESDLTVKSTISLLLENGVKTSADTVRKSLNELCSENVIIRTGEKKSGYKFNPAPVAKKRGWKMALIRKVFAQAGGTIKRVNLAKMVSSDERNTHIMISGITKSWTGENKITWDRKLKSYNY